MRKVSILLPLIIVLFTGLLSSCMSDHEQKIRDYINLELKNYPEAHLVDLYKNYFQDAYGPGHLIPDTSKAGAYLDWELKQQEWKDSVLFQPLGINHDYSRVNLILVKNGIIPRDTLLLGMLESASFSRNPDMASWKKEWADVLKVISKMNLNFPEMEADEQRINETLAKDDVVMHHSKHYVEVYHPHYRIIHRKVMERWKQSLLK